MTLIRPTVILIAVLALLLGHDLVDAGRQRPKQRSNNNGQVSPRQAGNFVSRVMEMAMCVVTCVINSLTNCNQMIDCVSDCFGSQQNPQQAGRSRAARSGGSRKRGKRQADDYDDYPESPDGSEEPEYDYERKLPLPENPWQYRDSSPKWPDLTRPWHYGGKRNSKHKSLPPGGPGGMPPIWPPNPMDSGQTGGGNVRQDGGEGGGIIQGIMEMFRCFGRCFQQNPINGLGGLLRFLRCALQQCICSR